MQRMFYTSSLFDISITRADLQKVIVRWCPSTTFAIATHYIAAAIPDYKMLSGPQIPPINCRSHLCLYNSICMLNEHCICCTSWIVKCMYLVVFETHMHICITYHTLLCTICTSWAQNQSSLIVIVTVIYSFQVKIVSTVYIQLQ